MFYCGYQCDKCGRVQEYSAIISKHGLTMVARRDGWSVGTYVLCPNCRRGKKKKELQK